MPIYEFYCSVCHTVFSFFSSRIAPEARPACPRCGRPDLDRRPSRFATPKRTSGNGPDAGADPDDPFAGLDEGRLEGAMEQLAGELDGLDGEGPQDPHAVSRFLRRFTELAGLEAGPKMQEMLARLDRGEDPDDLEADFGGEGESDEDLSELFRLKSAVQARRRRRPEVDETLYFL